MLKVNAIKKKSHAKAMNTSKDRQNLRAGPYAPSEIRSVKKFANVLTTMLAGSRECRNLNAAGSLCAVATSKACMIIRSPNEL